MKNYKRKDYRMWIFRGKLGIIVWTLIGLLTVCAIVYEKFIK
jgi:hypothetical protein